MTLLSNNTKNGIGFALVTGFFVGLMGFFVHKAKGDYQFLDILLHRSIFLCLVLLPFAIKHSKSLFKKESFFIWPRCFFGCAAMLCFFLTLQNTHVGIAILLANLSPVLVILLGILLLKEEFNTSALFGSALIIAAVALLGNPSASDISLKIILIGLLGSFLKTLAFLSLRKAAVKLNPYLIVWMLSFIVLIVILFLGAKPSKLINNWDSLTLINISVISLLMQISLTFAYKKIEASFAVVLILTSALWGMICEILFLNYRPTLTELAFCVLLILGIIIVNKSKLKKTLIAPTSENI